MRKIEDDAFKRFRKKVKTVVREDWGWNPTGWTPEITYRLSDGRTVERRPETAKGQPPELLSFEACIPKYRGCVEGILEEERIARSLEIMRNLESCEDVGVLMRTVAV